VPRVNLGERDISFARGVGTCYRRDFSGSQIVLYVKFLSLSDFLEERTFSLVLGGAARCAMMDQLTCGTEAELRVSGYLESVSVAVGAAWLISNICQHWWKYWMFAKTNRRMR
jgi:hypothetical protein